MDDLLWNDEEIEEQPQRVSQNRTVSDTSSDGRQDRKEIPIRDKTLLCGIGFDVGEVIGSGQNAYVYHGVFNEKLRNIKKTGDEYILSEFGHSDRHNLVRTKFAVKFTEIVNDQSHRESQLWSQLQHPFIVELLYVLVVKQKRLYIFMEYADNGSVGGKITELVTKGRGTEKLFTQNQCLLFIQQLSEGLEYIHKKGIIHKDIHSSNALIFTGLHPNGYLTAKWADFGLSQSGGEVRDDLLPFGFVIQDISEYTEFRANDLYIELIDLREKLIEGLIIRVEDLYKQYENVYNFNPSELCQK